MSKLTPSVKTGVLISNLGTPDAPTFWAVRRYLKVFLSDPYVIDLPRWKWLPILNLIILNIRPFRSAKIYRKVWTAQGSPLLVNSEKIREKLEAALPNIPVALGMRYGRPSLKTALQILKEQGVERIIVLPLYPQYSRSTAATTFAELPPDCVLIQDYHQHPLYIKALKESIEAFWAEHGKPEKLLFSYHGLPARYVEQGDPYYQQCVETTRLLRIALNVDADFALMSFQSRVGFEQWLSPYTIETVENLAKKQVKNLQVICPGFSCDCLETLEEIDLLNREAFLEHGGENYAYIPALNASDAAIALFKDLIFNTPHNVS